MSKLLQLIADEKDGFSFGKSWRYSEDSLVALLPILRVSSKLRKYLLLSEAKNVKIKDTGQINKLSIENSEKKPVYIRMGEMFSGSTQERMATRSYIIMPKEKTLIDVRCVHASKGIFTGASMSTSGIAPSKLESYMSATSFKMRNIEQRAVWKNVNEVAHIYNCSMSKLSTSDTSDLPHVLEDEKGRIYDGTTFTDDLKANINKFSDQIKNILKKVPYFKNQVGLALIDLKGINAIECFDLKDSWKKMKEEIVKKEGEKISKQQKKSPFQYKEEKAKDFVKIVLTADYEEKTLFKSKDWRIIGLKNPNYVGEITELKDKPIHLTLVRTK